MNSVDHTATEQASITRFIENNWGTGRIGDASFDQRAGSLSGLFDFKRPNNKQVLLNSDGSVKSVKPIPAPLRADRLLGLHARPVPGLRPGPQGPERRRRELRLPALPISVGAGLLTAGTMTTVFALRRRRGRAGAPTAAV